MNTKAEKILWASSSTLVILASLYFMFWLLDGPLNTPLSGTLTLLIPTALCSGGALVQGLSIGFEQRYGNKPDRAQEKEKPVRQGYLFKLFVAFGLSFGSFIAGLGLALNGRSVIIGGALALIGGPLLVVSQWKLSKILLTNR